MNQYKSYPCHAAIRAKGKQGQTLVEYGLILVLVSVAVIVAVSLLGNQVYALYAGYGS
ncbi:MAG: hypothetical protein PHD76_12695 [Methylacidiphilales bacterium]|nr:hypothetical protein [Candidatus Methylacidiphilales bacterium]